MNTFEKGNILLSSEKLRQPYRWVVESCGKIVRCSSRLDLLAIGVHPSKSIQRIQFVILIGFFSKLRQQPREIVRFGTGIDIPL